MRKFSRSLSDGLSEATKETRDNNGQGPKTIVFTGLATMWR